MKRFVSFLLSAVLLLFCLMTVGCSDAPKLDKQPVLKDGVWEFTLIRDGGVNASGEKNTPLSTTTYGVDASGNIYVKHEASGQSYEKVYVYKDAKNYEVFARNPDAASPEEAFTSDGVKDYTGTGNIGFPSDIFQFGVCYAQYLISAEGYAYEEIDALSWDAQGDDNALLTLYNSLGCKYYKLTKSGSTNKEIAILPDNRMMLFMGELTGGGKYEPMWVTSDFRVDHSENYSTLVK